MARLLIVEDDPTVQRSLIRALQTHTCVAASNGAEALKCLESCLFDLVVSDVDMPIMNGIDFYHQAIATFPDLAFIFRTGSNIDGLHQLGVPILSKDLTLCGTLEALDRHLGVRLEDAHIQITSKAVC